MEASGRPLFDNPADAALFVHRMEADRLEANCRDGVNTLVVGKRGMGKTTLLRYVLFRLREEGFPAVGVDLAPARDALDVLRLVAASLGRTRSLDPSEAGRSAMVGMGELGETLNAVRALRSSGLEKGRPRTAILLDSPLSGKVMHQLFGRFRDELWQLPYTWVLAIPQDMRGALLAPPADAFFEDEIGLGPLDARQQQELIGRRLGPGETMRWRLPQGGEDSPRRLLQIMRESLRTGDSPERRHDALKVRHAEVKRLGSAAAALYEDLEDFGPASASDQDLLERMGWSRQRAAQVLAELEQADLVRAEFRHGPSGRPRKVFAVLPPPNA